MTPKEILKGLGFDSTREAVNKVSIEERYKEAVNAHQQARYRFAHYEGKVTDPQHRKLADEVDRTLTHVRVLEIACLQQRIESIQKDLKGSS